MPLKVSIIITTFNREKYLKETLNSILNQTYKHFELIVVDNNSNYNIVNLITSFNDNRLHLIQNNNNGIIAINRNIGIKNSSYDILAFCDDDDIWYKEKLENQIKYIHVNKLNSKFVIYTNCINFTERKREKTKKNKINDLSSLIYKNPITYSTVIMSKSEILFNEQLNIVAVEDYLFWCELLCIEYNFKLIEDDLLYYRVLQSSASNEKLGVNHLKSIYAILYVLIKYQKTHLSIKNIIVFFYVVCREMFKVFIKYILNK
jgi:teichuronic acid biosynthesis glycosyltransferase TuaG